MSVAENVLPEGVRLFLDRHVERYENGQVLFDPLAGRVIRLSAAGTGALERLSSGGPVSTAERALGHRLVSAGFAHPVPLPAPSSRTCGPGPVTVVIPVRDRPDELERCLEALGTATVVVVDDGSGEPGRTARICSRGGADLVRLEVSRGPGGARNAGLERVATPLVAFLDSDCRPGTGWLAALAGHLEDPSVAAVAPRVRPMVAGTDHRWLARYERSRSPLDMGTDPAEVRPGGRVGYVPSAALLVRRSWLEEAFDETMRYGEDVDLVWRISKAGGRIRYDPSVVVEHEEPGSWRQLLARRFRYGTSAAPLALRHDGEVAPVLLRPRPAAAALLMLAGRPVASSVVTAVTAARLGHALQRAGVPTRRAVPLAARGTIDTAVSMVRAATMLAWPLLLVSALGRGRRAALRRGWILVALASPALLERRRRRPDLGRLLWCLGQVADDAAYGSGVLYGSFVERTARALYPRVVRRQAPVEAPATTPVARRPSLRRSCPRRRRSPLR